MENQVHTYINKKYPHLINVKDEDLVKGIQIMKAKLYDMEKSTEHYHDMLRAYERTLMERDVNDKIHYFDSSDRYRIDEDDNTF